MGLHGLVSGLERRVGSQPLGHVGFLTTGLTGIQLPGGLADHQFGGIQTRPRLGQRKRHPLVLADRTPEHHPFTRVLRGPAQRRTADAQRLRGNQDALRVEARQQIAKALAFLTDTVTDGHRQIVVHHLTGGHRVAADLVDRRDRNLRALQLRQQQRHAVGAPLARLERRGAHQQQHALGDQRLGGPHLAAAHDVVIALAPCQRGNGGSVGTGIRLGDAEGAVQLATGDPRQVRLAHLLAAVANHRFHAEDRQVQGGGAVHARAGCGHLLEHDGRLGDATAAAAVLLRNGNPDPATGGHRVVERPRELVLGVTTRPVLVRKVGTHLAYRIADQFMLFAGFEIHRCLPCRRVCTRRAMIPD